MTTLTIAPGTTTTLDPIRDSISIVAGPGPGPMPIVLAPPGKPAVDAIRSDLVPATFVATGIDFRGPLNFNDGWRSISLQYCRCKGVYAQCGDYPWPLMDIFDLYQCLIDGADGQGVFGKRIARPRIRRCAILGTTATNPDTPTQFHAVYVDGAHNGPLGLEDTIIQGSPGNAVNRTTGTIVRCYIDPGPGVVGASIRGSCQMYGNVIFADGNNCLDIIGQDGLPGLPVLRGNTFDGDVYNRATVGLLAENNDIAGTIHMCNDPVTPYENNPRFNLVNNRGRIAWEGCDPAKVVGEGNSWQQAINTPVPRPTRSLTPAWIDHLRTVPPAQWKVSAADLIAAAKAVTT